MSSYDDDGRGGCSCAVAALLVMASACMAGWLIVEAAARLIR